MLNISKYDIIENKTKIGEIIYNDGLVVINIHSYLGHNKNNIALSTNLWKPSFEEVEKAKNDLINTYEKGMKKLFD